MGIALLPPDVNESGWYFTVVGKEIRFGLGAVKGVGEGADRVDPRSPPPRWAASAASPISPPRWTSASSTERSSNVCVKAGAFDSLGVHRAALWKSLDRLLDCGQKRRQEREEGQHSLFGMASAAAAAQARSPWSPRRTCRPRPGPSASGCASRRRPWASTSPATRSPSTRPSTRADAHPHHRRPEGEAARGHGHRGRHGQRLQPGEDQDRRQRRPLHGPLRAGGPRRAASPSPSSPTSSSSSAT